MSSQATREFLEKLAGDHALRDRLVAQAGSQDERMAALVEAGRQNGFEFAADDVRAALRTELSSVSGELDDQQLAQVTGGGWFRWANEWLVGPVVMGDNIASPRHSLI